MFKKYKDKKICALTYTVNLKDQVCCLSKSRQSTRSTEGWLQLVGRNIIRMISGDRMHLSQILSFVVKAAI